MTIEAVIFDIGGVLELTPATGWEHRWADELGLRYEDLERRMETLWRPGELGHQTLEEIEWQAAGHQGAGRLGSSVTESTALCRTIAAT